MKAISDHGDEVDSRVQEKIDHSPCVSLLADESTDIASNKKMSINLWIVKPEDCQRETLCLTNIKYNDHTDDGLANCLKQELQKRGISPPTLFLVWEVTVPM